MADFPAACKQNIFQKVSLKVYGNLKNAWCAWSIQLWLISLSSSPAHLLKNSWHVYLYICELYSIIVAATAFPLLIMYLK